MSAESVSQCPRCGGRCEGLYTVPVALPASESRWYLLCAACFRAVLGREPSDEFVRRLLIQRRRRRREAP